MLKTNRNERIEKGIDPGAGAAAYARALFAGMTREEMEQALPAYLDGEMRNPGDKRIKDCAFCGYMYRDETKPNNSKTCSPECKKGIDAERKREKRHAEGRMHQYDSRNYERPHSPTKMAQIDAAKQRDEIMGGRRGRRHAHLYREAEY